MTILNIFANQSGQIPLSELDANFATPITIGTTLIQLGQTTTTLTGVTLSGANLGTPTGNLANCVFPTLNQNTTGTASNVTGIVAVGNGGTGLTSLTAGYIPYGNGTSALNSSAGLFFDGTNLGIGTSSPGYTLDVRTATGPSSISSTASTGTNYAKLQCNNTGGSFQLGIDNSAGSNFGLGAYSRVVWNDGAYPTVFTTTSTERMRIDSSGNVGIGTSSPIRKLHVASVPIGGGVSVSGTAPNISITNADTEPNANTMTSVFVLATASGNYGLNAGEAGWLGIGASRGNFVINPNYSGAGTKDIILQPSSGNVGIGTSSPSSKLSILSGTNAGIVVNDGTVNTIIYNTNSTNGSIGTTTNHPLALYTNNAERMRIDSSGNVGIGASSPAYKLNIVDQANAGFGFYENNDSDGPVFRCFRTRGTTAAPTAVQSGDVLAALRGFGYTSAGAYSVSTATLNFYAAESFTATAQGSYIALATTPIGTTTLSERARITSAGCLSIGTTAVGATGQILATGSITASYSDRRLKTNINPITSALDKVDSLTGMLFTQNALAESFGYTDKDQQVGVFAQEVQAVLPEAVKLAPFDMDGDGNSKSGENYLTVQYEKLVPLLIEAIKELRAEVKDLRGN